MQDLKPPRRVRDPALLKRLHLRWRECALCLETKATSKLSLHHIHRHPRDDVEGNLVMLCGDGVSGCHGDVTANDPATLNLLMWHLRDQRPDVMDYLERKLGGPEARDAWVYSQCDM